MPEETPTTTQETPAGSQGVETKSSVPTITDPAVQTQKEVDKVHTLMYISDTYYMEVKDGTFKHHFSRGFETGP